MSQKSILVTATTFPRWKNDTEPNFVFLLSEQLERFGHKVTALVPHFPNAKKYEKLSKITVYRFSYFFPYKFQRLCYDGGIFGNLKKYKLSYLQMPLLILFEFFNAAKLIKKEKVNVLHAHWVLPQGFIAYLCKKIFRIPYIVTAHAGDIFPLSNPFFMFFSRLAIKGSEFCTANSSYTKKQIKKIYSGKDVKVIPMGVNTNIFSEKNKDEKLRKKFGIKKEFLLSVGRLAEKKGIKYLVIAMKKVTNKFPDAKLMIIGNGPEKKNLESICRELNLDNKVIFIGKVENRVLPKFYATADLFIAPSIITESGDTEGLGIVLLESLASGTCIIGSKVGGIPDIIKHKVTGVLVKEKNAEMLADSIIQLLSNPKLRKRLAFNGQKMVKEKFCWERIGKEFNKLIMSIQ